MKKIILFLIVIGLAACNNSGKDEETIRKKISEYKQEVNDINAKIAELEKELEANNHNNETFKVPVMIKKMSPETFNHYFEASGSVEAVHEAYISPETGGQIKEIFVKEGDRVSKGQLLAKLNTDITANTIKELESSLDHAVTVYEKQKRLWDNNIGSEIQYLNAKNNMESLEARLETVKAQNDLAIIRSPVDGIVDEIFSKEGELAMPGVQLMQVVNLNQLYINADIAETHIANIHQGDVVTLSFPVYPELEMEVPVYRTGNVINPQNRTFNIKLKINNTKNMLKPNILAVVKIKDYSSDVALVVPSKIIKQDINGQYLYVLEENGTKQIAQKVYVATGKSYQSNTLIENGIKPGDKVIIEGFNLVSDGTEVKLNV